MKPAPFAYHRPRTLDEALSLVAAHADDVKPLAGGQSLIPAMNFRLAAPSVLVDLNEIGDLAYITRDPQGGLRLGAMTRHALVEKSPLVAREAPLMHEAMPFVGHTAIRTRGTIGGSLAHADPAAELPAVMLALDARFRVCGQHSDRWIPATTFFTGVFSTALEPGELLVEIAIPETTASGWSFKEVARRHGDFALAGAAALVTLDGHGRCASARLALLGVGDRPLLASEAAMGLVGERPSNDIIRAAADSVVREVDPTSDIHASSRYRRQLASVLGRRALEQAFLRAASVPTP